MPIVRKPLTGKRSTKHQIYIYVFLPYQSLLDCTQNTHKKYRFLNHQLLKGIEMGGPHFAETA